MTECTVTELSKMIKNVIGDHISKDLKITCEISSISSSGDNKWVGICDNQGSMITVTFWKCYDFPYIKGDKVIINGYLQYYEKKGYVNLIGRKIEKLGIGELQKKYQKNYDYLERNGYFKKSCTQLPSKIDSIGILTAKEGDALQDFLYVLRENHYTGQVVIYNCNVQGVNCPNSIINGIDYFSQKKNQVDVLVLTRGGGSYEDLMGFSDTEMLKKLFHCKIYTISAIGHQNDIMLSDLVANHRSPTPSLAGKDICEKYNEYPSFILSSFGEIMKQINEEKIKLKMALYELENIILKLPDTMTEIDKEIEDINYMRDKCYNDIKTQINGLLSILDEIDKNIDNSDHQSILEKGYCMLTTKKNKIINSIKKLRKHKNLNLLFNNENVKVKIIIQLDE